MANALRWNLEDSVQAGVIRIETGREPEEGEFDGEAANWPAFRDNLLAEVHERPLTDARKIQLLQKACTGRAKLAIGSWRATAENYAEAWKYLYARYNDDFRVQQAYVDEIMDLQPLGEESAAGHNRILDVTTSALRRLETMGVQIADWDYQRIDWRRTPSGPKEELWIVVVICGEAFSTWVAPRALVECGENQRKNSPLIADIRRRGFYMDDYLGGAKTIAEGWIIKRDLTTVLDNGGFVLDKWMSNAPELLEGHEESERSLEKGNDTNVLGIVWYSAEDVLKFKINLEEDQPILTKRIITSQAAKVYEPIGFLLPVTIQAKLFIQNLWRVGGEWGDGVPPDVASKWLAYYSELSELRQIAVPRWLGTRDGAKIQMHGFSDASQKAYGVAIYMRVMDEVGHCRVELITAKSRVAPLKTVTLPRLELMAAELLVEIMQRTKEVLELDKAEAFYWTDSECVLFWLRRFPCELKTFVSHRVAAIQSGSNVDLWTHIESKMNPADLISRGVSVKALIASQLWWHGPEFLTRNQKEWPVWKKAKLTVDQLSADQIGAADYTYDRREG